MSWLIINIVATWAAALSALTCFFSTMRLLRYLNKTHRETMASLNEMSDTYKQAWAIVCEDLNRLRARIEELEAR